MLPRSRTPRRLGSNKQLEYTTQLRIWPRLRLMLLRSQTPGRLVRGNSIILQTVSSRDQVLLALFRETRPSEAKPCWVCLGLLEILALGMDT